MQVLRNTVVQIEWQRGGATVFYSVNFAGYIGVLTGLNPVNRIRIKRDGPSAHRRLSSYIDAKAC